MRLRSREFLDVLASLAMLTAAIAIVLALFGVIGNPEPPRPTHESYATGETFPAVPNVPADRPVAILWLQSQCRYCGESMAFYRRAVESHGAESVIVMGPEPESQLREYLNKNGLGAVPVSNHRPGTLKFSGTPTLAVLGRDRRVAGVWVGKVSPAVEDQILSALSRLRAGTKGLID